MKLPAILTITALTCLLVTHDTFGQQGSVIDSLIIIPSTPTVNDEIKLVCYVTFPTGDCLLNILSIDVQENDITVMLNYTVGDYTAICHSVDTLTIGTLSAGSYELTANLTVNLLQVIFDTDTISFTVDNTLGISDVSIRNEFEIYPNPFSGEMTIYAIDGADLYSIEIYSLLGNKVFQEEIQQGTSIDVSHLTNGLYVAILTDSKGHQYEKKIVKHTP